MAWKYVDFQAGRPKVGLGEGGQQLLPHPLFLATSQMKMQLFPASHGHNTLGTHVPRMTCHGGAENMAGRRVPGTRTGTADLDNEGTEYPEKRVM